MDANAYQYQSCKDDETTAQKQAKSTQPYSAQSFSIFLHLSPSFSTYHFG